MTKRVAIRLAALISHLLDFSNPDNSMYIALL